MLELVFFIFKFFVFVSVFCIINCAYEIISFYLFAYLFIRMTVICGETMNSEKAFSLL